MSAVVDLRKQVAALRRSVQAETTRLATSENVVQRLHDQVALLEWDVTPPTARVDGDDPRAARIRPSLVEAVRWHKRTYRRVEGLVNEFTEPVTDLYLKSDARDFAEAHGVGVARILGEWATPDDIAWDSLPDRFVVKSTTGGGGISVFPLTREGEVFYDAIGRQTVAIEDVTAALWTKHAPASTYFVEEFLTRVDGEPGSPHDVKVFCFFGEPGFIEMRTEDWSRFKGAKVRTRTFLPTGEELFDIRPFVGPGYDLDAPRDLGAIVEASRALSGAIRRPIVRLDFFETDQGLVFGEVTQHPGRLPLLIPEWDEHFGEMYESAFARVLSDVIDEGELRVTYGDGAPKPA